MGLILRRCHDETWREAAIRQARKYGLEIEVTEFYDRGIADAIPEDRAAWEACYEWDVLDYEEP